MMDYGRLFQTVGPAREKARALNLVRVHGTMMSSLLPERRHCHAGSLLAEETDFLQVHEAVTVIMNCEHHKCYLVLDPVIDWQPVELLQLVVFTARPHCSQCRALY